MFPNHTPLDTHTHTHTYTIRYTHTHALGMTPLHEWSARRRDLYLHNTQQIQEKSIHCLSGIRDRDPSNQAVADLRLRPHDRPDRQPFANLQQCSIQMCIASYSRATAALISPARSWKSLLVPLAALCLHFTAVLTSVYLIRIKTAELGVLLVARLNKRYSGGLKVRNSCFLEQLQSLNYCGSLMIIEIISLTHEQGLLTLLPTSNSEMPW
jgi:hypothetical protein